MFEFKKWPKIPRIANVKCYLTEKLDGTNAVIYKGDSTFLAGSRNGWLNPPHDNSGFGLWAMANKAALCELLPDGYTYGEWVGLGIQRGYGLSHKALYLFNRAFMEKQVRESGIKNLHVVPYLGVCTLDKVHTYLGEWTRVLVSEGSRVNGFMRPEGIILNIENKQNIKYIIDK